MNEFLDWLGEFISERRGLLPLVGLGLIIINLILQIVPGPGSGWFVDSNLLLHIGLITSLIGILLIRAL
ncbi:MAG: hypothetical protein GY803_13915 [Chloroflexi bacterium]|nr:hypothetical protein [Chloroflexota bacterium]